jgi:putative flippase GtrA
VFKYSFFRYGLVGGLSVGLDFLFLYTCIDILGFSQILSVSIAFLLSTVFNFLMHRRYTFKNSSENMTRQLIKYILLIVISYYITLALIAYLVDHGFNIYFAKLITVGIVYLYGYVFGRFFVFSVTRN